MTDYLYEGQGANAGSSYGASGKQLLIQTVKAKRLLLRLIFDKVGKRVIQCGTCGHVWCEDLEGLLLTLSWAAWSSLTPFLSLVCSNVRFRSVSEKCPQLKVLYK